MSASSTTSTNSTWPTASAPLLPISKSTLHSHTSSGMSDVPLALSPCSSQFDTNGTAPSIDEQTIYGGTNVEIRPEMQLDSRGNEEVNNVEVSYVTQLRNLAQDFLEGGSSAGGLEVNLSLELLGFYEEDLKKRQCIIDEVYVEQITHLLERIAVAQDLHQDTPKPTRLDLFHLLLGNFKNQFETMVRLARTVKTTLAMVEELEGTFASREARLYSRIQKLQEQLDVSGKDEGVKLTNEEDGLADESRVRGGSLSDKLVALNDSYTVLVDSNNALEKENTLLRRKNDTTEKKFTELKERLEKENKRLKHKNSSLEKGENVNRLKQRNVSLEKGNKEQKQRNDKLEQENRRLKQANDSLEKENRDLKQVNGNQEKETKQKIAAWLDGQSVTLENIVKKQDDTAGTEAGSPPPSEAVIGSQMPGRNKPRVKRKPDHGARLGLLHGYSLLSSETR